MAVRQVRPSMFSRSECKSTKQVICLKKFVFGKPTKQSRNKRDFQN